MNQDSFGIRGGMISQNQESCIGTHLGFELGRFLEIIECDRQTDRQTDRKTERIRYKI